jgi:hypothetical protein
MSECGNVRTKWTCVVISSNLGWQLSSDHTEARWSTKRRVAIGIVKYNALGSQLVDVGGLDWTGGIVELEQWTRELISNNEEDVWLFVSGLETIEAMDWAVLRCHGAGME